VVKEPEGSKLPVPNPNIQNTLTSFKFTSSKPLPSEQLTASKKITQNIEYRKLHRLTKE
jgi:hypothetical protein